MDNSSTKKIRKNLTIVGGGITGCILALLADSKKYKKIEIFDISKRLGGVLKDLEFDNDYFFNGCQYLDTSSVWFNRIKKKDLFVNQFNIFKCKYGSFTDFENKEIYSRNYPEPIFHKKYNDIKLKKKKLLNLNDRLSCYPKKIRENLSKWVVKFGLKLEDISADSAENGLMISRVFLSNHLNQLQKYKKESKLADRLYGIPKKNFKLINFEVATPKKGFKAFFEQLKKELLLKNVEINLSSSIKPYFDKKKFIISNFNNQIESNKIVWATNPTSLIKSFDKSELESKHIFVRVFTTNLDTKLKENFYINIFSHKINIFRMYCYNLNGKSKITIECFKQQESLNKIYKTINKIFLKFKIKVNLKKNQKYYNILQKRFFLTSVNDDKILKKFYKNTHKYNIINGAWEIYHREKKINKINSYL